MVHRVIRGQRVHFFRGPYIHVHVTGNSQVLKHISFENRWSCSVDVMLIVVWMAAAKFVKLRISGHIHQVLTVWEPHRPHLLYFMDYGSADLPFLKSRKKIFFPTFNSEAMFFFAPTINFHVAVWNVASRRSSLWSFWACHIISRSIYSLGKHNFHHMQLVQYSPLCITQFWIDRDYHTMAAAGDGFIPSSLPNSRRKFAIPAK
jgi:hypothetical protein